MCFSTVRYDIPSVTDCRQNSKGESKERFMIFKITAHSLASVAKIVFIERNLYYISRYSIISRIAWFSQNYTWTHPLLSQTSFFIYLYD